MQEDGAPCRRRWPLAQPYTYMRNLRITKASQSLLSSHVKRFGTPFQLPLQHYGH